MEDVLLVGLLLTVVWLGYRVSQLGAGVAKLERLDREMDRLRERLAALEQRPVAAPTDIPRVPVPQAHLAPVVKATTIPAAEVRATPASAPFVEPVSTTPPTTPRPVAPAAQAPIPPPQPYVPAQQPVAHATAMPPIPAPHVVPPPPAPRAISFEERLGQNWLNKLGIVALVTGLVLFLGREVRTFGPLGKSLLGLTLALAILITGLVLERRERYRVFARAAIGGGWALLYFVTFALYHLPAMQVLQSQATDLILMLGVAAVMVVHSLRYRSQVVTSLAFLLAFFTVSISHVTLFSLVAGAILAVGLVVVAFREHWFVLALGGLVAVYLNHFLWLQRVLPDGGQPGHAFPEMLPSAALLLFYWLLFRLFYIFRVPENDRDRTCSTLNVVLNSTGLLALLKFQSTHPEWAFRGLLALGIAELVLAFVARRRHHNAFVALSCIASLFLLAAVPFHFTGANWSLLWLLQSEMLFVAGLALREKVFRRLGLLSAFAAVAHLLVTGAVPVFNGRQVAPDASHHLVLTLAFACAALAAWFNAEFAVRRWPYVAADALDRNALIALSYVASICAAIALWLTLAGPWTLLPWLALSLLVAFVASRLRSRDLAQQADLLASLAVARGAMINFSRWEDFSGSPRTIILLLAIAMTYAHMRRRQPAHLYLEETIEPLYAWLGTAMLAALGWYALEPAAVSVAWCMLGLVLLELGLNLRKPFFLHQAYVLLAASFVRMFFTNVALAPTPRLYTMLPLALAYAWAYHRLDASSEPEPLKRIASDSNAWLSLATVSTLLYFALRPSWVAIGGAALSVALLLLARVLRRPLFSAQAFVLIVITTARALAFNLFSTEPLGATFSETRLFTLGLTCLLLFAGLPIAFSVRKQRVGTTSREPSLSWLTLDHPEQMLFFAPLAVLIAYVAVEFHGGIITVGWSALGLLTFLFALTVGERSFRLAGLGLLLVGVAKIIGVDIWHATSTDRYITLIVMGVVLLLVSFLYSRYRETILKLL